MKQKLEKFLEFNGKRIVMLAKDGTWWIALSLYVRHLEWIISLSLRQQIKVRFCLNYCQI